MFATLSSKTTERIHHNKNRWHTPGAVDKNKYYEIESLLMFDTLCNKSVNELSTKKEERNNKENNTF